jgi:hypothetical protein
MALLDIEMLHRPPGQLVPGSLVVVGLLCGYPDQKQALQSYDAYVKEVSAFIMGCVPWRCVQSCHTIILRAACVLLGAASKDAECCGRRQRTGKL